MDYTSGRALPRRKPACGEWRTSLNDPLPVVLGTVLPPSAGGSAPPSLAGLVLVPLVLLLLAAFAGGLRALLASPLRHQLLAQLPGRAGRRKPLLEEPPAWLPTTVGLVRIAGLFAAVVWMVRQTDRLAPGPAVWTAWILFGLAAALLLECVRALVLRGRGLTWVLRTLPLIRLLALPLRPLTALIASNLRRFGADPAGEAARTLAEEVLDVASETERQEALGETERRMIEGILELPETDAAEVMTPRTSLAAITASDNLRTALEVVRNEGHSRIPVYEDDLDHIVGIFHAKDILAALPDGLDLERTVVREHMRAPFFIPETTRVPAILEEMRRRRNHLAVVVDEYGGTAGVVTIEDLLEEIVGEIEDEHDTASPQPSIENLGPGEVMIEGIVAVGDLNEALGVDLPEDEGYDTVAGLIFQELGRIPTPGESLQVDGVYLEVVEADDRRIRRIRARRERPAAGNDAA
ncbi:MAG: hemolysin family protein [Planctomycetota bacterium]